MDNIKITDCHVHSAFNTDIEYELDFLKRNGIDKANIIACGDTRCLSLVPKSLLAKEKHEGEYFVFGEADLGVYLLDKDNVRKNLEDSIRLLMDMGCDGIKLLEGKPQMRKFYDIPDFDTDSWEGFFSYAEENRVPILWHVNDPEDFWDAENAPSFAVSQGWLYDESYVNNEDQYRQVLNVLRKHPKLNICFAHFYFMSAQLERLASILDEFENVRIDLTPGIEMYENFSGNIEETKKFFEKYHDRILFGTDIGGRCVLMGEEKGFDELENTRRPLVVRSFLENKEESLIESDGHYIIGRPSFVLRPLGLSSERLKEIYSLNFERFVSKNPKKVNREKLLSYCMLLKTKLERLKDEDPSYPARFEYLDDVINEIKG